MKKILAGVLVFIFGGFCFGYFGAEEVFASTNISNMTIVSNTTWTKANGPYVVGPNASMVAGTLTIEPGVQIVFNNFLNIEGGNVVINGTKAEPVSITSTEPTPSESVGFRLHGENAQLHATWMSCTNMHVCILEFGGGKVYVNHGDFMNMNNGIAYGEFGVLDVRNSYFRHGLNGISGSYGQGGSFVGKSASINVVQNYFDDMSVGAYLQYTPVNGLTNVEYLVENNTFKNALIAGAVFGGNGFTGPYTVGANYYGDPSGPHSDAHPTGLGVQIYYGSETIISPWLTAEVLPIDDIRK